MSVPRWIRDALSRPRRRRGPFLTEAEVDALVPPPAQAGGFQRPEVLMSGPCSTQPSEVWTAPQITLSHTWPPPRPEPMPASEARSSDLVVAVRLGRVLQGVWLSSPRRLVLLEWGDWPRHGEREVMASFVRSAGAEGTRPQLRMVVGAFDSAARHRAHRLLEAAIPYRHIGAGPAYTVRSSMSSVIGAAEAALRDGRVLVARPEIGDAMLRWSGTGAWGDELHLIYAAGLLVLEDRERPRRSA